MRQAFFICSADALRDSVDVMRLCRLQRDVWKSKRMEKVREDWGEKKKILHRDIVFYGENGCKYLKKLSECSIIKESSE